MINITPHLPASSTNLELFTIMKALELFGYIPNIEIITDSNSAILAIKNFQLKPYSLQLKSHVPHFKYNTYHSITRKSITNQHTTFTHIFSHLLDKKKTKNYNEKIKIMKEKFKTEYKDLLKENQKCDNLANSTLKDLQQLPTSFYGLPKYILALNDKIFTHSTQIIPKIMSQSQKQFLL